MASLHLYNPENDMALAFGGANYTPAAAGWQMHLSGEALPLWYGSPGDRFLSYGISALWLDDMRRTFGMDIDVASRAEISSGVYEAMPWGWSAYASRLLADAGYPAGMLPGADALAEMRRLSGRAITVDINRRLRDGFGLDASVPEVVTDAARIAELCLSGLTGFVKQPWSCSGRGVFSTAGLSVEEVVRRSAGSLRRQGYVMWEPALDGVRDFAMLYCCAAGTARFEGYSLFRTVAGGAYTGNVLATQQDIKESISEGIAPGMIDRVREAVRSVLSECVASGYSGPVGVDMMIHRLPDGTLGVAPCIEVNLRNTMGFVALRFADRYLELGSQGLIEVIPRHSFPAGDYTVSGARRLVRGTLPLSPPSGFAVVARVRAALT